MSYPQPDADRYLLGGSKFFRLQTPLTSPGDIYESQQSGFAFALGPESDVSRVNIAYFDDQMGPSFVNTVAISNRRAFVGEVNARNDAMYSPSNRPGRVLIWPADAYDPSYIPSGFVPGSQTVTFISPVLDVIEYFQPQQSLLPQRNDKTYRFQQIPNSNGSSGWIVIPYWGRRSATIRLSSFTVAVNVQIEVRGVDYIVTDSTSAAERTLLGAVAVPPGGHIDLFIKASSPSTFPPAPAVPTANGTFDALSILLQIGPPAADGPVSLEVTVSDSE